MKRRNFIKSTALSTLGFNFNPIPARKKTHILSLSFDDGFKKSFYRIAEIHETYGLKACLNVIASGHLPSFKGVNKWIRPELMGNFDDWNQLKGRGHEIMPHTWDHLNLTQIPLDEAKTNIDRCLDYFEQHLEGYLPSNAVYNFAFNASTPELDNFTLQRVRAVRTGGWLILKGHRYNPIPVDNQPLAIGCWGHGPDNGDAYTENEIQQFLAGPGGWLIINMHGLDDEGWGPVSTTYLDGLLKRLVKVKNLDILPVGEVLKKVGHG